MDILEQGIDELGIGGSERAVEKLRLFIREIEFWNPRLKLVKAEGEDLIARHILDSLAGIPVIRDINGETIGDIGSGNGLPGIPLALWLKDRKFFLVEKSGRRCAFLRNVIAVCGINNAEVLQRELNGLREVFDVCVFRALGKLQCMAGDLAGAVRKGGVCLGYKGRRTVAEAEAAALREQGFEAEVVPASVPFLREERCFVVFAGRNV